MSLVPFRTAAQIGEAVLVVGEHLERGGLLAYPTETVYGLGSRTRSEDVNALSQLKGRRAGKAFLLLVSSRAMAEAQGLRFTKAARVLSDLYWPGPLTLVLSGGERHLPDALRGPEGGIAVRWTSHAGLQRLITELGYPITSTSANRPGHATAPGPGAIVEAFAEAVSAGTLVVLDGGTLGNLPPSTVLDCTGRTPHVIREGAIPLRELRSAAGSYAP
ncbi:MAG: Sua5/YciO/YrdC/YwlC family protein [Gemmatimonadota bacterium]|nr:Sua5/YciO/YrdC/YwlC family protein [Gemmatimonadota bacterium]MDH3368320.1 Sua5/YciO/YrdC/YwlC family protein [Gemmatimonadota bacterium]MDH3479519.1 Sua5/YciO/YrdC/YwlC family protein [Gemmatimonadota bacterium]MDH5549619.1 Sua5/YciO/YrdC/YwlC family protein [Gemmatimonadota bacterium]